MNNTEPLNANSKLVINKVCKNLVNLSFVHENKEYEITVEISDITYAVSLKNQIASIPADVFVHPACCEHPDGCPGE